MRLSPRSFHGGNASFRGRGRGRDPWDIRLLLAMPVYAFGKVSSRLLPAGVGVLPLVNVAVVGTWLLVVRRLRSRRPGRAPDTPSSWSGITYFSLHFAMLIGLISLFGPDERQSVQVVLDAATESAAHAWGTVLGEPGETVPWLIFDALLLGILVSGPPLLFSWVGGRLARRCDATLPRRRFQALTGLVSLGFAMAGLAIALTPQPIEEEREIAFDVQVIDQASGRPIAGAVLWVIDPFSNDSIDDQTAAPQTTLTDADGRARLHGRFDVRGDCNAFVTMGVFSPWGHWLEVAAADHQTRRISLTEVLGLCEDPRCPGLARVALDRGETPEDSFRDLAGIFTVGGAGFGGSCFNIEPDGRFAWLSWGCTFNLREYGYLKRHDRAIELVPIPHPGQETHPAMALKYRVIAWGKRLYLSPDDAMILRGFCREALIPNHPSESADMFGSYLRVSDKDRPQTGLPRVPLDVWAGFLAVELSLDNKESIMRLAPDAILPRIP